MPTGGEALDALWEDLARAIAAGHAEHARQLMTAHFQAQHDYYREHWPARLHELVEWR